MSEQSEKHGQGAYLGKYIPSVTPKPKPSHVIAKLDDGTEIYHRFPVNAWTMKGNDWI